MGPLPSDLGPALYRVNGRLEARHTTFEQAEPELRDELAADRARRLIEQQAEEINDLLAGGATLEDLANESDMEVASLGWSGETGEGITAYEGFRTAVIGSPEGGYGWILDRRATGGEDRITAAQEILDFNGYDLSALQMRR